MSARLEASIFACGGWLTGIWCQPRNAVLVTAKATGRAVRISQDGVFAVAKGMGQAATWSKEQVAGSAKVLNPLAWVKRPAGRHQAQKETPPAAKRVVAPPPPPRPPRASPRSERPSVPSSAMAPEVTYAEAAAAVFAKVSEKVMFAQALRDLAGQDQATRARAAAVLGTIQYSLSVRVLAARCARDPSAEVRKECVNALTALGKSDGLPAVERALSDRSTAVRLAAVRGVYRLAGPAGAPSLIRMLFDEDDGVRRRTAVCIGWLGRAELTADLLPLLDSESAWVRLAALDALGNLKSLAAVDPVIALLEDPEEPVQRRAFEVLGIITGKQMYETFPQDEKSRRFLVARWRAWREESAGRGRPSPA